MPRKIIIFIALLFLISPTAFAEDESQKPELVVAFSSDLRGYLADCGCPGNVQGGLGRRAAFLKNYQQELGLIPLIHLDAGGFANRDGPGRMHTIAALLEAYEYMQVDAINISELEIYFFQEELLKVAELTSIPMISANIAYEESGELVFPDRIIIKRPGLTIGITGIADPGKFSPQYPNALKLSVLDPVEVLPPVINQLQKECDVVILMAHEQKRTLPGLLKELPRVDLVVAGDGYSTSWNPDQYGNIPFSYAGSKGRKLMIMKGFDIKEDVPRFEQEMIQLTTEMDRDAAVVGMIERAEEAITEERSQISFRQQALKQYGKDQ